MDKKTLNTETQYAAYQILYEKGMTEGMFCASINYLKHPAVKYFDTIIKLKSILN